MLPHKKREIYNIKITIIPFQIKKFSARAFAAPFVFVSTLYSKFVFGTKIWYLKIYKHAHNDY